MTANMNCWTREFSTNDKYFDVFIEYAKADIDDICIKITAHNRGDEAAPLHILPTVWFRNRWTWYEKSNKPQMKNAQINTRDLSAIELTEEKNGDYWFYCEGSSQLLFTENETNFEKIYNGKNTSPFAKDGINDFVVENKQNAINPKQIGTKAAAHYDFEIAPHSSETIYLRLSANKITIESHDKFIEDCETYFR